MNCLDNPAVVLMNRGGNGNHWVTLQLEGRKSNRDAVGARVTLVSAGGLTQHAMVSAASSFLSANDKRIHFGLGTKAGVKSVEILWPGGNKQTLRNVTIDRITAVRE